MMTRRKGREKDEDDERTSRQEDSLPDGDGTLELARVWVQAPPGRPRPARLLETYEKMHLVEWESNRQQEYVPAESVTPRRPSSAGQKLDNHSEDDDDDDDDEVKVLLTILPPSPKKAKRTPRDSTVTPTNDSSIGEEPALPDDCTVHQPCPRPAAASLLPPSSPSPPLAVARQAIPNEEEEEDDVTPRTQPPPRAAVSPANESDFPATATNLSLVPAKASALEDVRGTTKDPPQRDQIPWTPKFFARDSAYLQSLAEICFTLLWDLRWRTEDRCRRLWAWEDGEDLSAVHLLARQYLPPPAPPGPSKGPCGCLLCDPSWEANCGEEGPTVAAATAEGISPAVESPLLPPSKAAPEPTAHDRSLNLFARLYFRKGPWFRVDDLFFKYYLPKRSRRTEEDLPHNATTRHNQNSPSKFFLPRGLTSTRSVAAKKEGSLDDMIDQDYINEQLEAVVLLLEDLEDLCNNTGLIRTFGDEEECGKTVGARRLGLLRQEEQRAVLGHLGGGGGGPKQRSEKERKHTGFGENLIWKQMCQQQSLLATATMGHATRRSQQRLPVAKHVDQTILSSWANSLVLRASKVDYVPQSILRRLVPPVQKILADLLQESALTAAAPPPQRPFDHRKMPPVSRTCWRMREAPLRSLRRFCRLYLCATSGPGQMRGDTSASPWRTLPLDTVLSVPDHDLVLPPDGDFSSLPPTHSVPPPGSQCWHQISYPGRDLRFKRISCPFQRAHTPLWLGPPTGNETNREASKLSSLPQHQILEGDPLPAQEAWPSIQVFDRVVDFRLWEWSVDLRAIVDYLLEANELLLYQKRKRAREGEEEDSVASETDTLNANGALDEEAKGKQVFPEIDSPVDFLRLLTKDGRQQMILRFIKITGMDAIVNSSLQRDIQQDVDSLRPQGLSNDCERVLCVIGIIILHILSVRMRTASKDYADRLMSRPWLRHLCWEGNLAYLLWDILPILERRGHHLLAIKFLEILLFGRILSRASTDRIFPETLVFTGKESAMSKVLLSRRARGKAYERLMIDYMHIFRKKHKDALKEKEKTESSKESKDQKRKQKQKKESETAIGTEICAQLCLELLHSCLPTGQITFSAARTLARRLKQPLSETLRNLDVLEVKELGHRLSSPTTEKSSTINTNEATKKYSDWVPITDFAVANAIGSDGSAVGSRCSYVGFEERELSGNFGSLNVEELALEFYNTGRLPKEDNDVASGGGWVGWHDEGGKIRSLFRILSSTSVLGMDWSCLQHDESCAMETKTIHLTPYQGAPFDLHVGAEQKCNWPRSHDARPSFYTRRQTLICKFLRRLQQLKPQSLADLVRRSVALRLENATDDMLRHDPSLERDILQVRTLSAMAAGIGGRALACIFRCFFFDYRHYSGGLPDLTLIRARYAQNTMEQTCVSPENLVNLGEWIGESFSVEQQSEQATKRAMRMFEDQDEEFLGCSKVGDSGGVRSTNRFVKGSRQRYGQQQWNIDESAAEIKEKLELPPRLLLSEKGQNIRVECMFVEVKSQSDRLDARQEDWLNILDLHSNARVCKFGKEKSKAKI